MRNLRPIGLSILASLALAPEPSGAATGGPDAAGYTWSDSDEPGVPLSAPPYTATDLTSLGFNGDESVIRIDLPPSVFPTGFRFYGQSYSAVWVSSNGWLSFRDPAGQAHPAPAPIPTAGDPEAIVAALWGDWTLATAVPIAEAGPSAFGDSFVIMMIVAPSGNPGLLARFTYVLDRTGSILVVYAGDVVAMKGTTATAGLENAAGTIGLPYMTAGVPANGANFRDGYSVLYQPPPQLDCSSQVVDITCNGGPVASSNQGRPNNVDVWNCSASTWAGNERVMRFTLARNSHINAVLTNTDGRNRALFLVRSGCNEFRDCIVGGTTTIARSYLPAGTYYLVADGATSSDNGNFQVDLTCVDAVTQASCGSVFTAESTTGTDALNGWSCLAGNMSGPEKVYEVTVSNGPATLRSTLTNAASPFLYTLLSDASTFDPAVPECIAAGSPEAVAFNVPNGTYLVSVDGLAGASGTYDLEIECERALQCPSPAPVIDPTNPAPVFGDTSGGTNTVSQYYCETTSSGGAGVVSGYTGPEDVYEFTITQPSVVSFLLSSADPDMRLLILGNCYEGDCITEAGCAEQLAPGTYRLVVDGLNGAQGAYVITPNQIPSGSYSYWWECPECQPNCGQTPATVSARSFSFNSGNYCGTGCDFSLFAVVECGTEFHLPFFDVETGHVSIYDVLRSQYVNLTANNNFATCPHTDTGTLVEWEDSGCTAIPCPGANCGGGGDCRTNGTTMDVSFRGAPTVCGIYRIDLINWGGFAWDIFANCTGNASEQFLIYRDLCSALANYRPLPEVGLASVTIDNSLCGQIPPRASGTFTVENIGCIAAVGAEIVITEDPPGTGAPKSYPLNLTQGQVLVVPWTYDLTALPGNLTFRVDPNGQTSECSENVGTTVSCGTTTTLSRTIQSTTCPAACATIPDAGPNAQICEGASHVLDGSGSAMSCMPGGVPEYRWEDAVGNALPGCDWGTNPVCPVASAQLPSGSNIFRLRTRCTGNTPPCEEQATVLVDVIQNVTPPSLGNVLRGAKGGNDVLLSWASILGVPISAYRLYKDGDEQLPLATRVVVAQLAPAVTTTTDANGVPSPPLAAYYQIVGVSCLGDLEGPY